MRPTRLLLASLVLLLLAPAFASMAVAADSPTLGLRYASLTPDGESVVFAFRGDIWIAPVDGQGNARRLTIHEAQDTVPRVSPDGKKIAFSSTRNGGYDIYVMDIDGGLPKQITFHAAPELLCGWSPDGKKVLVMTLRHPSFQGLEIYEVDLVGGTPRRITYDGGREASYDTKGERVVYARGTNTIYQDNYTGAANHDLWIVDAPGALPRRLTETPGNERYPFFSADDTTVFFVAEEEGVANFYAMPADGGERRKVTSFKADVWRPDLGADRKTAVFEQLGRLYTVDLTAEKPTAKALPLVVRSDVRHSGIEVRQITTGPEQVHVSPGGDRLVFAVHGDLWMMPTSGGPGVRLTEGKAEDQWPRFSPDGRTIAFQSDRSGNSDIFLMDLGSKKIRPITKHQADDFFHSWAPDGSKLVFSSERSGNREIWVLDLESGQPQQITDHPAPDDDPTFSPDGQWIAFDSGREGSQAIYIVAAEGGTPRRVTSGGGFLQVPSFSPDGSMLVYESYDQATGGSGGLYVVSTRGGPSVQLTRNGATASWSPKGDYIFYTVSRNGSTEIFRHPAPTSLDMSERVPFSGRIEVDRREEFGNLFDEAWTRLRDGFYDPKMHGVDWDAMRKRYRPIAVEMEDKSEFYNVMRQMIAELGASHTGIRGSDEPEHVVRPKVVDSGQLGMQFATEPEKDGGYRVASVMPGGPAEKAGLRVGDIVLRIGRSKLTRKTNLDKLLAGTVGKDLPLTYRQITADGLGRELRATITPAAWRDVAQLNYRNWVERSVKFVRDETKGTIAYIHLDMMNGANLARFQQAVAGWVRGDKVKGMILDVRYNGGGNIHEPLIQILRNRPFMVLQPRGAPKMKQPALYWDRPVTVLINERSFSDAEVFPYAFRTAGLGKLIGQPTAGGVIGTNDIQLADGTTLRIPRVGWFGIDGTRLEGSGVQPDILVAETPEDRRKGRDPQLEKAIEVIRAEIKERAAAEAAPEATPEATPETTPETTPAPEEPQAPIAVDPSLDPLADAKVGEWVRYRLTFGGSETLLRLEVVAVDETTVTFRKDVESGGSFLPPLPDEMNRGPILAELVALGPVKGHRIDKRAIEGVDGPAPVLLADVEWAGAPVQVAFTNHVPCIGLFEARLGGEVVLQAIAWGGPAATPVAESPAEPAAEPVAAPTNTPTETPAEEETTEEPSALDDIPNPLGDAEVGEWTRHRQPSPQGPVIVTTEVVAVEEDEVVLQTTIDMAGNIVKGPEMRRPRTAPLTLRGGGEATVERRSIEVGGETLECFVVTSSGRRGGTMERWFCPDVPVRGLVKVVRGGEVLVELLEWGTGGAP